VSDLQQLEEDTKKEETQKKNLDYIDYAICYNCNQYLPKLNRCKDRGQHYDPLSPACGRGKLTKTHWKDIKKKLKQQKKTQPKKKQEQTQTTSSTYADNTLYEQIYDPKTETNQFIQNEENGQNQTIDSFINPG